MLALTPGGPAHRGGGGWKQLSGRERWAGRSWKKKCLEAGRWLGGQQNREGSKVVVKRQSGLGARQRLQISS